MDLASKKCVPCEGTETPFTRAKAEEYLKEVNGYSSSEHRESRNSSDDSSRQARTINNRWELVNNGALKIRKKFKFSKYLDGVDFVNKVAKVAESEGHHPDMLVGWRRVTVDLMTHAIGGLSENDFILAAKIDKLL